MTGVDENVWRMEQAVLGAVMDHPEFIDLMLERLPLESFGNGNSAIARALASLATDGKPFSPTEVVDQMRIDGTLSLAGNLVVECWDQGRALGDPRSTIGTLAGLYALRDAKQVGGRLAYSAAELSLPAWVALAKAEIERIEKIEQGTAPPVITNLRDYLTGDDVTVEWAVPGLIPRGTATMLTAEEGVGKSTVLRQIGMSAMAGTQPFTPWAETYEPVRVLLVDCEVSKNQLTRSLRSLWSYARGWSPDADTGFMAVESHQAGLNFSDAHDQAWLHRMVREHKAEMLVVGPVYRFTDADLNSEEGVRTWQRAFEPLLADGIALVTEHHAPNGQGQGARSLRPIGSSAMRRWFAQGIALRTRACDVHEDPFCPLCTRGAMVESWRGSRDEEARWPRFLKGEQGSVWWLNDEAREVR